MLARSSYVALLTAAVASLAGCCCEPWGGCYPCGKNWCGPQCGALFWNEWFSIPPPCCDPCDACGRYIGPRLNDGLYSHGNDYRGWCEHRHVHPHYPVHAQAPEPVVAEPAETAEPYTVPGPETDLPPEVPLDSTTGAGPQYRGGPVSNRAAPYQTGSPQRLSGALSTRRMSGSQVDSRGPFRKLARPPRTRLFSR